MKTLILKTLFVLFIFSGISTAQENIKNLTLVESIEKPNCEVLFLKLDRLMNELWNKPETTGYVVIHGGEHHIENIVWERAVGNYVMFRGFDVKRISVLTTQSNQPLKIEVMIAINGAKPNVKAESFSYVLPVEKPILFAADGVEVVKIDGKETSMTSGCAGCCLNPLEFDVLSMFLEANPQMNAEIRIFNKSKKHADKLAKLILDEAKNEYKISPARLKIKYSGKGERDDSDSSAISDVETWLIGQKNK